MTEPIATLQTVDGEAVAFEGHRRQLLQTAIKAHLDNRVSANAIATTLAKRINGPGWGRDRVLAILAAARVARTANRALQNANLGRVVVADSGEPVHDDATPDTASYSTTAYLRVLTGARIGQGGARAVLAALNAAGLTVDGGHPETENVLAESTKASPALILKPLPRP
jgi:hypothetical protein